MATTGVMNGTLMRLYLDQAAGVSHTVMGNSMDVTFNSSHSPRETTNQTSGGNAEFLEGKRSYTIDFNNLQSEDGAHNFWLSFATFISPTLRAKVTAKLTSAVPGDKIVTVTGYFTALNVSTGGPEGNCTMNGSIQVTGLPVVTTAV